MNDLPQPKIRLSRLRDIGFKHWDLLGLLRTGKWNDERNRSFAGEYDKLLIEAAYQLQGGVPREQVAKYLILNASNDYALSESDHIKKAATDVVNAMMADDLIWRWPDEKGRFSRANDS